MPQILLKLIFFLFLCTLSACQEKAPAPGKTEVATFKQLRAGSASDPLQSVRRFNLAHPSGRVIKTVLLVSPIEQEVGLSGTKAHEFEENEGALFWYPSNGIRRFWMPDTYFNLDLVFLDEQLTVIDIDRNLVAHPGRQEPPEIAFSKTVQARHVLEVKAGSPISDVLKIGDRLQVLTPLSLSKIESEIRQKQ